MYIGTKTYQEELQKWPKAEKEAAEKLPKKLSENPFFHQQIRKIEGTEFGYRLRLGRWRILFALFQKEKRIEIVDIFLKKVKTEKKSAYIVLLMEIVFFSLSSTNYINLRAISIYWA